MKIKEPERKPQNLPPGATSYATIETPLGPLTLTASPGRPLGTLL